MQVEFPGLSYRFSNCSCAVSPDGGRIAYWTTRITPDSSELRVLDLARGMTTTTYKPPRERRISHAAWSSDGTGVVFSMEGVKQPGEPVGDPPNLSLLVIDASGGDPRTLDQNAGVYVPLGWDRAAGVAAAIITGEGGYMTGYVTARTSGDPAPVRSRVDASIFSFSVDVSSDQRYALGTFWKEGQPGATLRWWRLTDFSAMTVGPRLDQERPRWRPGTAEIAWVSGSALRLLDIGSGATRDIAIFPGADYRVEAFRHDGSAVVGVGTGGRRLFQIASGRGEPLPGSGQIAGAVRLR